jgi:Spy/CpxP family protein refolding chaperone
MILAVGLFAGLAFAAPDDNPNGNPPPPQGGNGGPGGGQGAGRGPGGQGAGFHLIPRFAEEKLNLTDDQKKQVADLESEIKAKLEKILTPEQMKTLAEARPPRRGGPGGQGGPGGGPGGQGGPGGGPGGPPGEQGQGQPPRPNN